MYSVFFHAHQKLDKVAYRHLNAIVDTDVFFPSLKRILYFEGQRGPDSTNLKNNINVEQPWHFINPFDDNDTSIFQLIEGHYDRLVRSLKAEDSMHAAYEASWLAHALVDGLTPAHHYPYEHAMEELRGGETRHNRKGLVSWMVVRGDNRRDTFKRSLQLIGPKGLLTTHTMFEGGAFSLIAPLRLNDARPSREDLRAVRQHGITELFLRFAKEVASHDLYRRFYQKGWTPRLARDVRREMAPRMVMVVTLAWYSALCDANLISEPM
jgi:hypothetical protein